MEKLKTSTFSHGLIWFGAAVSIAEILTGTFFAPLGLERGILAIIIGHIIGCILLYFAGLIGGQTGKTSMETVKMTFGKKGAILFSALNVLQLTGWTAVMINNGASAANSIINIGGEWIWSIVIGLLISIWVITGLKNLSKINIISISALFILTIILSTMVFKGKSFNYIGDSISFGSAVELSVAMPLSWLPLISDYIRTARKPKSATLVSSVVYFFASCWMYIIGMGAAIFTGKSDIAEIMMSLGFGFAALFIIVFSTVTTTFLDAYSAGISAQSICNKSKAKISSIIVCALGTLLAIFTPVTRFEDFLYLVGSVFAPMIAIQIIDYYIMKNNIVSKDFNITNIIAWIIGFMLYRVLMNVDTVLGSTLPVMIITGIIGIILNWLFQKDKNLVEI